MRNPKTLIVVGAGASKEAGLPLGQDLIKSVADKLAFRVHLGSLVPGEGDEDVLDVIQQHAKTRPEMNSYLSACRRVREGVIYSNSIDSFIDVHRKDELIQRCGKLAIAKTIIESERNSHLFLGERPNDFANLDALRKTWFFIFSRYLNDGVRKEEIERIFEKVSFLVFNYDRCIEHFFYHALQRHFGIDETRASSVMKTLRIIHPYGTIGDLTWQSGEGIPFGARANRQSLQLMTSRIRTYTEQIERDDILSTIRSEVENADTLVFLGFSYHPQNMKVLDPQEECMTKQVFGTAYGISSADVSVIEDQVRGIVRRDLTHRVLRGNKSIEWENLSIRNDLTCFALLNEYSRSLFVAGPLS